MASISTNCFLKLSHSACIKRHECFFFTTVRAFGGFLRGQILQAVAIGVGTGVILAVFGIQAALLSGVFAGVFMLIPLLGPILAFLPPLIAVLLFDPSKAFIVMITIALLQVIVVNAVMPGHG